MLLNPKLFNLSVVESKNVEFMLQSRPANLLNKGHPPSADLGYGGKDSISPSTLISAAIKSKLGIYTLHVHPVVPKKLGKGSKKKRRKV